MVEAVPDEQMDGEMDGEMDEMEGMDPDAEGDGMDEDDEDGEDAGEKNEYVKKEYIARPWESDTLQETVEEVENFTIKNSR